MAIYKVTYSERYRRVTLHNYGCNFRCRGCTYKLKKNPRPQRFPCVEEIQGCLERIAPDSVHFMGGEPTTNPQLSALLSFCKHDLGVTTRLGHTNGSGLVLQDLDGSNVSFKAFDEQLHREYTGHSAAPLLENFRRSCEAGLDMKASTVFNPDFGGLEQVEKVAAFVGKVRSTHSFPRLGLHSGAGRALATAYRGRNVASCRTCPTLPRHGDILPFHLGAGARPKTAGRPLCSATGSLA